MLGQICQQGIYQEYQAQNIVKTKFKILENSVQGVNWENVITINLSEPNVQGPPSISNVPHQLSNLRNFQQKDFPSQVQRINVLATFSIFHLGELDILIKLERLLTQFPQTEDTIKLILANLSKLSISMSPWFRILPISKMFDFKIQIFTRFFIVHSGHYFSCIRRSFTKCD